MISQSPILQKSDPYVSRAGTFAELAPRQDPEVWGDAKAVLGSRKAGAFARNGFLFEKSLFSGPETKVLLEEAQRLVRVIEKDRPEVIREPDNERVVRTLFRIHRLSPVFRNVCKDPRLLEVARALLGSEVYVHQSRINFKPALDGREFFWHSDFETWHVEDGMPRMRALSISLALTENTEFNGPLMVIPGSHKSYVRCVGKTPKKHFKQSLQKQEYGVPTRGALEQLVEQGGIQAPKGPAGSAVFFDCNTMHGSAGNLSPYPRTNLFLVFNSVENQLVEPFGERPPRPEYLAERDVLPVGEW